MGNYILTSNKDSLPFDTKKQPYAYCKSNRGNCLF